MGRGTRDLEASLVVAAAPERVWAVVADVRRTPSAVTGVPAGPHPCTGPRGSLLVGGERRGPAVWVTRSRVDLLEPGRALVHG